MIEYINKRLNDWARWRVSDRGLIRHALGARNCWPDVVGEAESTDTVRQHGTLVPLNDLECADTDKAVCALPQNLKVVIVEFYCRLGTTDTAASRCGVSRMTLYRLVNQAHWLIMGSLNDLYAGLPLATPSTLPENTACIR